MRILHVEDDQETRDLVACVVTLEGWEYVGIDNAQVALKLVLRDRFDLFLLDNWLPGYSGNALAIGLRSLHPTTPILFYSAAAYQFDVASAIACGAQGYLPKPSTPESLIAEIRRVTGKMT